MVLCAWPLVSPGSSGTTHWRGKPASAYIILSSLPIKANATGGGGHVQMVQRAMEDLTYASLCFPEAIKARGMESTEDIPYYFYRDDGILVWEAIKT